MNVAPFIIHVTDLRMTSPCFSLLEPRLHVPEASRSEGRVKRARREEVWGEVRWLRGNVGDVEPGGEGH